MEDTIKAIRAAGLDTKVWVGAVLTRICDMIGADKYCKKRRTFFGNTRKRIFFGN